MRTVLKELDVMKQYTKKVEELISEGHVMKIVGGSNSMYEYASHFQPTSDEFYSLIVALERKNNDRKELGLEMNYEVDIFDLVVKNVEGTFDDGVVVYSKRLFRLSSGNKKFYVETIEEVKDILNKRSTRWSRRRDLDKKVVFNPTVSFVDKIKVNKGFTNAKKEKVEVTRISQRGYKVVNTALKTKPELDFRF